jgi:hypothetical protein
MDKSNGIEQRALDLFVQHRQLRRVDADGRADLPRNLRRGEDVLEVGRVEFVE